MDQLKMTVNDDGIWACRHVELSGEPAPSTQLQMSQTVELNPGYPTSAPRRWVNCPECGTYWRVWPELQIAKPSIEFNPEFNRNVLRQRLGRFVRKTLSFSKTDQMHENCLRLFLHHYNEQCLTT